MIDKVTFGIALIAIILSAGTLVNMAIDNDTNPQTEQTLIELKTADEELWKQFGINFDQYYQTHMNLEDQIETTEQSQNSIISQLEDIQSQVTELQAATKTLSKNQIDIPETTETKRSFYLYVTDSSQNIKNTFGINEAVYFTGRADDTTHSSVTYKIFAPNQADAIYTSTVGIPAEGTFSIAWIIPSDAVDGTYTLQMCEPRWCDSITFKVE